MINDEDFQDLIDQGVSELPKEHRDNIKNVAILYSDYPTQEQRTENKLRDDQTLLGLYEGVPLSQRQGMTMTYPDRITLFKYPLFYKVGGDKAKLKEEIKHTVWHEVAHYYGLNHDQIHNLEK
jgi:predicted Zn-dependent protease with MMP-like domain